MSTILLAGAALAAWVFTLVVGARAAFAVLDRKREDRTEPAEGLHARISQLEIAVAGLPSLWETERARSQEERERAEKAYAKARAAESRSRRLMEDSEEDEDGEDQGILPLDGGEGDPRGMYPLSGNVAQSQRAPSNGLLPFLLTRR